MDREVISPLAACSSSATLEERCLLELQPAQYAYYDAYEGIDPRKRVTFHTSSSNKPKISDCMQCKAYECVAFGSDGAPAAVLFWRKVINSAAVFEEHLSAVDFELLQTAVPHPLLWAQGALQLESDETSLVDLTDIVSLNTRNTSEIKKAADQIKNTCASSDEAIKNTVEESPQSSEENNKPNSNVNEETTTNHLETDDRNINDGGEAADTMSALGMGGIEDNDENTYYDGDEKITVHTVHCPVAVLNSERKLVDHLAVLYDVRSGVASKSITVGDHRVDLYPFHYPDENLEAPRNDKQRTYVDPTDLPSLFAYDWKNALCTRVQRVIEYINNLLNLTFTVSIMLT